MNDDSEPPVLTDLIAKGDTITMADLGFDDSANAPQINDPPLSLAGLNQIRGVDAEIQATIEHSIRRVLDKHHKIAMQEISLIIQRELNTKN